MEGVFAQDITGPTVLLPKRRRAALSCLECRRRKIKCDRNDPCIHCKRTPGTTCLYKNLPLVMGSHRSASSDLTATSTASQRFKTQEQGTRDGTSIISLNRNRNGLSPSVATLKSTTIAEDRVFPYRKRILAAGSTADDPSIKQQDLSCLEQNQLAVKEPPNTNPAIRSHKNAEETVQIHSCTVNAIVIHDGKGAGKLRTKFSNRNNLAPNKGSAYKMQFFGPSHWKHCFQWVNHSYFQRRDRSPLIVFPAPENMERG